MRRMHSTGRVRLIMTLVAGAWLAGASGCSIAGHWMGSSLKPEMARDQFPFLQLTDPPAKFVSTDLRLQQDGSYTAETNYGGQIHHSTGTWKYDNKGFLNFTDNEGNTFGYGMRKLDEQTIEIVRAIKGTDVTLTLKKQP